MKKLLMATMISLAASAQAEIITFDMQVLDVITQGGEAISANEGAIFAELDIDTDIGEGELFGINSFSMTYVEALTVEESFQGDEQVHIAHTYEQGSRYTFNTTSFDIEDRDEGELDGFAYLAFTGGADSGEMSSFDGGYNCQSSSAAVEGCEGVSGTAIDAYGLVLLVHWVESEPTILDFLVFTDITTGGAYSEKLSFFYGTGAFVAWGSAQPISDIADELEPTTSPSPSEPSSQGIVVDCDINWSQMCENLPVSQVPVPGAVWLFSSALAGFGILARRRNRIAS
ncbi:putative secreted protein [Sinobacterium caligoides]|uniref:Putative secreted protein n=1 Tax=Sinobacterium caligoides TaxID=933926 RepID=A0A3N2DKB5_9GAMM|nr:VPLPA-CTERM sorting domain-containing protein [Sinobacterium caligoides]ROS00218.1 putative secreted protein [Sinobacterium caligoides]